MNTGSKFQLAAFLVGACCFAMPSAQSETTLYMKSNSEIVVPIDPMTRSPEVKRVQVSSLVDIFTHKTPTWIDGSPIIVIDFPDGSVEQKLFIIQNLAMTPYQYKTRKERYLYRGRGMPPITVHSQDEMYQKLLTTNNAIGYLSNQLYYRDDKRLYVVEVVY